MTTPNPEYELLGEAHEPVQSEDGELRTLLENLAEEAYAVKDHDDIYGPDGHIQATLAALQARDARVKAEARIDQMHIEAEAYRKTLDNYRISHPGAKPPRGLLLGFQKRINSLHATLKEQTNGK